jgi:hypothetical protein
MRLGVGRGLNGKGPNIQENARKAVSRFSKVRNALVLVLDDTKIRQRAGEEAFASYLNKNPDYAALWGYAVIISTPAEYAPDLEKISIANFDSMVDALKEELDLASQGNEEAKKMLIEIGIDDSISSTSSRDLLAHALYLSQARIRLTDISFISPKQIIMLQLTPPAITNRHMFRHT